MNTQTKLTRRAAFATALGLTLAPVLLATAASARGGIDPSDRGGKRWKPNSSKTTPTQTNMPEVTRDRGKPS